MSTLNVSRNSLIYVLVSFSVQGLSFVLLPVYTRYLPPDEYGVLALTNTVGSLIIVLMGLGLQSALTRFYFGFDTDAERKRVLGTISITMLIGALGIGLLLQIVGDRLFAQLTPQVPYTPYFELVVWTSVAKTAAQISIALVRCQENAYRYGVLTIGPVFIYHVIGLVLVAHGWHVVGVLLANLVSTLLFLPINLKVMIPEISLTVSMPQLKDVLLYSLPLVPHSISGWALSFSDRLVMQPFLPLAQIGVYSTGYTLGGVTQTISSAINTAWYPSFVRTEAAGSDRAETLKSATYLLAADCFLSLALTVASWHFVTWFLPQSYLNARLVVFWVSLSGIFSLLSWFWSNAIHYSKKTVFLPLTSMLSGALNIGLNLWLIPIYGMLVPAITTAIAFGIEALLNGIIAVRVYPVAYDYRQWFTSIAVTIVLGALSNFRPQLSPLLDVSFSAVILLLWVTAIIVAGGSIEDARASLHQLTNRLRAK